MKIEFFDNQYWFLSNFYEGKPFLYNGEIWNTAEHAFQAHKTLDLAEFYAIKSAPYPGEAKRMGRSCELREDWDRVKEKYMSEIVEAKFRQSEFLRQLLLDTGDVELVEGNTWHDNVWGDCICTRCKNIKGENLLGKILMAIREKLREK